MACYRRVGNFQINLRPLEAGAVFRCARNGGALPALSNWQTGKLSSDAGCWAPVHPSLNAPQSPKMAGATQLSSALAVSERVLVSLPTQNKVKAMGRRLWWWQKGQACKHPARVARAVRVLRREACDARSRERRFQSDRH
jgi:hypothetical protein